MCMLDDMHFCVDLSSFSRALNFQLTFQLINNDDRDVKGLNMHIFEVSITESSQELWSWNQCNKDTICPGLKTSKACDWWKRVKEHNDSIFCAEKYNFFSYSLNLYFLLMYIFWILSVNLVLHQLVLKFDLRILQFSKEWRVIYIELKLVFYMKFFHHFKYFYLLVFPNDVVDHVYTANSGKL